jgi:hypothetical protein
MKTYRHFWRYFAKFFLEWEMSWTKVVEKIKTHILCSMTFFRKSHRLWDNVEKYSGDWGATNDVTIWRTRVACWISKAVCTYAYAHAHALGYPYARTRKHTHTGEYVTKVSWTRLSVTLYVHCLSCSVVRGYFAVGTSSFCISKFYGYKRVW